MRTTVVHPEARPPISFREHEAVEGREKCAATESVVRFPLIFPRHSLPPSHDFLLAPLSLSFSLQSSAPLARAPLSSPSNPLRHALACVNHAYRFSFVGVSEGRAAVAHVCPLLSPFPPLNLSLFLSFRPTPPFFLTESGGRVASRRTPFCKRIRARCPILLAQ